MKYKVDSFYGIAMHRPEHVVDVANVVPPLWIRLWYGFTDVLYKTSLLLGFALAFTVATQPQAVFGLINYLVIS